VTAPDELRRRLRELELPGEAVAGARSWSVVRAAFAALEPVPRPRARRGGR
jgi:hypothetical protein